MKAKRRHDDPMRQTYGVAETARILGVAASTVRRRVAEKTIPRAEGLGKIIRIPKWWVHQQVGRPTGDRNEAIVERLGTEP
jgi:hypothetical protein